MVCYGINGNFLENIKDLHSSVKYCIEINVTSFELDRGVKKGCLLSPTLFNLCKKSEYR